MPVLSFSIPKAGDYIDNNAAQVTGERANLVRLAKEDAFHFNGFFADKIQQVLAVYYDDMLRSLVAALQEAFARTSSLPKFNRPIPIVLSGGTALPAGFRDRFEKLLREQDFPSRSRTSGWPRNPLYSTARGALIRRPKRSLKHLVILKGISPRPACSRHCWRTLRAAAPPSEAARKSWLSDALALTFPDTQDPDALARLRGRFGSFGKPVTSSRWWRQRWRISLLPEGPDALLIENLPVYPEQPRPPRTANAPRLSSRSPKP